MKHGINAIVIGTLELPIVLVHFDERTMHATDSGYTLVAEDAPTVPPRDEDCHVYCLHCIIDEHPEIGKALDEARTQGSVYLT